MSGWLEADHGSKRLLTRRGINHCCSSKSHFYGLSGPSNPSFAREHKLVSAERLSKYGFNAKAESG
jgi:hypothetical protein